jgi:uncharacterized protein (DUF1697 family)
VAYVALLRAVNLGDTARVSMEALRRCVQGAGFGSVRSLHASGNLVFSGAPAPTTVVERALEREVEHGLGLRTPILVRTAEEMTSVLEKNPFPREARTDPSHLVVVYLRAEPTEAHWKALRTAVHGPEVVRPEGRHAYIYYAAGIGQSRLTGAVIDRNLGTVGTGRNWNTSRRLAEMVTELAAQP